METARFLQTQVKIDLTSLFDRIVKSLNQEKVINTDSKLKLLGKY